MSWEKVLKEGKKGMRQWEDPNSPVAIEREKTYSAREAIRNKKTYEEFLNDDDPHYNSLTFAIAMHYAEQMLERVSDDDKYDEAQEALELVKKVRKAVDTLEDLGLQLQEILPELI